MRPFKMNFTTETESGGIIRIPLNFRGYKIKKPCGKGSFAAVVKVIDTNTQNEYAAKIIPQNNIEKQAKIKAMIENEISILQQANHPNIVQLYEIIELNTKDGSFIILIEELCRKGNLVNYINTIGFQNDFEKRAISRGIIEAIRYLHSRGIAHCDIKPDNILLDDHLRPKLCDFNLSKFVAKASNSERGGSKPYAAPELFKFGSVDFLRTDIWSLGIVIYSICELIYPYKTAEDARRGVFEYNSNNKKLVAFTKRCLKVNPLKRSTADELLNDPFLNLDDSFYEDDDEMMRVKKEDSMKTLNTSPNLADAKGIERGEPSLSPIGLPPLTEFETEDELDDDIFEAIYGYRRSSLSLDESSAAVDNNIRETVVYRRNNGFPTVNENSEHRSNSVQSFVSNNFSRNNRFSTVNDNDNSVQQEDSVQSINLNRNNRFSTDNDNSVHQEASSQNIYDDDDEGDGLLLQSGSFAFSLMLELGFDFELQNYSESSQNEDLNDDMQQDDYDDYEVERIEKYISKNIVKFKYEKKRKTKKKNLHPKRKERKDRRNEQDEE